MNASANRSPLLEIALTLLIPSLILMQLSKPEHLGAAGALVLALAFPVAWGLRQLAQTGGFGLFAGLGVVSLLLTGGIGLLELDPSWLAVKEAAVPAVLGLVVAGSALTRRPLVRVLLYTPLLLDVARIDAALAQRGQLAAFDARLRTATWMLAGSFAFSSVLNYLLATWVVTSPAGSASAPASRVTSAGLSCQGICQRRLTTPRSKISRSAVAWTAPNPGTSMGTTGSSSRSGGAW